MSKPTVGIVGTGIYIPKDKLTAKDISKKTNGTWTEEAVINKLGIKTKTLPGLGDGTQEMGVFAALDALKNTGMNPLDIDVILCVGEEWKEYPLTTSALYIQDKIGAINAWGIDVANRCCTTVSAMKMAKDMLIADEDINVIMVVGGYRNSDFIDFTNKDMSMMYNLGAGGGAIILKKNYNKNLLLGSHVIADGSLARTAGVEIGGTANPITHENLEEAKTSLRLMDPVKMKNRLNAVSMDNWFMCIDKALEKSNMERKDIDFLK
jgi:3-oxoacyl-[acyl-carrier-protein] synthase-3